MVSKEEIIRRRDLTAKIMEKNKDLGGNSSPSIYQESRYYLLQDGKPLIHFGETEGIIKICVAFHTLPLNVKRLVCELEDCGYSIDYLRPDGRVL